MTISRLIPAIASVLLPCVAIGAQPVLRLDGTVDPAVLSLPAGTEMRLKLSDGLSYPLEVKAPRVHPSGNVTWRARIVGQEHDGFIVTLTGTPESGLFGTALTPSGEFRVSPQPGPWTAVRSSPADLLPYRGMFDTVPLKLSAIGSPMTPVRSGEDHAAVTPVNVIVYYTTNARAGRDDAPWEAYLDNLFAVANEAYEHVDSDIRVRLERVHTVAVGDSNASNATLLAQLTTTATENVRVLHDAHLFTLLRGDWEPSHGSCGSAHIPVCGDDADCYDALLGYSVVSVGPDCPELELAHQTGHNFGSAHENPGSMDGTFDYSHGHVTAGGTGTVMSVGAATQVARFSSPALATGCGGDSCGITGESDNARSIETTRHFLARWVDERRIGLPGAPVELEQGVSNTNTFDIERLGVVGGIHRVSLWRNDVVVIPELTTVTYHDETVTFNVPFTVPVGAGYVVRFTSTVRPSLFFETPATVVEPPAAAVFSFTETFIEAPGTGGAITLTVERTGVLDGPAQIRYQTTGGSASGNFTPADGTLSWADGEGGTKTFTVSNVRSADSGQVTSLFVVLTDPSPGARVGENFRVEIRVAGRAGGGGGSFGLWTILVLSIWALVRVRRRRYA